MNAGFAAIPTVDTTGLGTTANQNTMLANQGTMGTGITGIGAAQATAATNSATNQAALIANQDTMGTGITDANLALGTANTNLTNLGSDVATGFAAATTQADEMQKAVLGGQTAMGDTLKTIGDNANTYYGDLSSNQSTITDNIGNVQTDLNTLRTDQSDANTLANIARADLAKTVTGGFDTVTTKQGQAEYMAAQRNNAVQQQLAAQSGVNPATTYSDAAANLSQGNAPSQSNSTQDFVNRLASVRNIIETQGASLDPAVLAEYTTLANGFDAAGKLVQTGVASNGNSIRRGLTQEGMLVTNTYNAQNVLATQTNSDINSLISVIQPAGQFGDLSVGGGIMSSQSNSPFIQQ